MVDERPAPAFRVRFVSKAQSPLSLLVSHHEGESMALRMRIFDREPIGAALRRFKKLLERSGVTKELRRRKYYEKPCEARRRAKLRKLSAIRKGKLQQRGKPSQ